jgi:PTS system galactosamine-specific IIB component
MPDIVHARIDNRLVHGQVGNSWVGATGANLVVVADDEVAVDPIQKSLMKMTADSSGCGIRFFSIQKTIDIIGKASPSQHIFLIVQNPKVMRALVEGGVPLKEVNVGNMHATPGKRVLRESHVYVDDDDVADIEAMKEAGVKLYIQILPGDKKIYL